MRNKKVANYGTVFWAGYLVGVIVLGLIHHFSDAGNSEKVCISYSQINGECETEVTIQELIDNARKAEKK